LFTDSSNIYQPASGREILEPPVDVQKRLRDVGGLNLHGDPNYRLIWGWSRKDLIWSKRLGTYDRRPRYFLKKNRWSVEMWHPAQMSPETWERHSHQWLDGQRVALLGPYPTRGDYEILWTFETPHADSCQVPDVLFGGDGACSCGGSRYLGLTPPVVEILLDMVKQSRGLLAAQRRNWYMDQFEKKDKAYESLVSDAVEDAGRPFGGNYFVPKVGPSPDHWPRDKKLRFVPE
jgi:hypothetical protein